MSLASLAPQSVHRAIVPRLPERGGLGASREIVPAVLLRASFFEIRRRASESESEQAGLSLISETRGGKDKIQLISFPIFLLHFFLASESASKRPEIERERASAQKRKRE